MRVVCIKDFSGIKLRGEILPVVGNTYTVREVVNYGNKPAYRLVEIVNSPLPYTKNGTGTIIVAECCFSVNHFRPVTDISDLTKLTKVRELEDA